MTVAASAPPLSRLRADLARLRRRRAAVRIGTAAATAGVILLAALAAAFAADYFADLHPAQRAVALLAIAFAAGWAASRFVAPWLKGRETETELALAVERQQGLEGDLVAALQFQSPEASAWGSPQLERAVVGYVDEASRDLSVFEGFSWEPLPRRLAIFGVAVLLVAAPTALSPRHAEAFLRRLMLADVGYPTRTVVTSVAINGKAIDFGSRRPLFAAAGAPLAFAVSTGGVRPEAGVVLLEADAGGRTDVALRPPQNSPGTTGRLPGEQRDEGVARHPLTPHPSPQGEGDRARSVFVGTLESFTEPVSFIVRIGDAKTPARRIEVVPLPAVTVSLKPTPPAYARANAPAPPPEGVRMAFVLEGSDMGITVRSANKPLERVTLTIGKRSFPFESSADRKAWSLAAAGTPLDGIREAVNFAITAVDVDGLSPPEPITGSIRLRPDRPPRVAAGAVVQNVLPNARPELSYEASDDFGVKTLAAAVAVRRADGRVEERRMILPAEPVPGEPTASRGRQRLDLASFGLAKGDKVVVTVEATDARGDRPGETAKAEPVTFEVTDREGLLATLLESDEDGAERLDAIIRRELGIGEGR
jgi:hypothetical protein